MQTVEEFNKKYGQFLDKNTKGLTIEFPSVIQYLNEIFNDLTKINGFLYGNIEKTLGLARFNNNLPEILPYVGRTMTHEIEERLNFLLCLEREVEIRLINK